MRTRKMNVRITFFKKVGEQNEDGEVLTFKKNACILAGQKYQKQVSKIFVRTQLSRKLVAYLNTKILKRF